MRDFGIVIAFISLKESWVRKSLIITAMTVMAVLLIFEGTSMSAKPSHADKSKNPQSCSGCHSGKGARGTPLLKKSKEEICYECHGSFGKGKAKTDIERVFAKRSRHPIQETTKYHMPVEDLPEKISTVSRHVSCFDCHKVHHTTSDKPWAGAKGYARERLRLRNASYEYELCYLCHSDSANLPSDAKNKREEFDPFNESFHPIEMAGRNKFVPSLVRGLTVNSKMNCTDCHGNNDTFGPRGPHGSDYEPLLAAEYRTQEGVESPKAYELCYMCHDRRSILADESFYKHNIHIVTAATSCYTCHNSHGSQNTKHLIIFNPLVVSISNTNTGPTYFPLQGTTNARCYLRCHDIDHNIGGVYRTDGTKTTGSW